MIAWQARVMHTQARGAAPAPELSLQGFKHACSAAHCHSRHLHSWRPCFKLVTATTERYMSRHRLEQRPADAMQTEGCPARCEDTIEQLNRAGQRADPGTLGSVTIGSELVLDSALSAVPTCAHSPAGGEAGASGWRSWRTCCAWRSRPPSPLRRAGGQPRWATVCTSTRSAPPRVHPSASMLLPDLRPEHAYVSADGGLAESRSCSGMWEGIC